MAVFLALAACLLPATSALAATQSAPGGETLSGQEIRSWFVGTTVRAKLSGKNKDYFWRFDKDGDLKSVNVKDASGSWYISEDRLCLTYFEVVRYSDVTGKPYIRDFILTRDCFEIAPLGISVKAVQPVTGVFRARFTPVDMGTGSGHALAQLSNEAPPMPSRCAGDGSETSRECQQWQKEWEAWRERDGAFEDTDPPQLRVETPKEVQISDAVIRITGLVGDDGSSPRIAVDGEIKSLSEPGPGEPKIGEHTRAFDFHVAVDRVGVKRINLEACDAVGNCTSRDILVRVLGTATATAGAAGATDPTSQREMEALRKSLEEAERQRQQAEADSQAAKAQAAQAADLARREAEARRAAEEKARRAAEEQRRLAESPAEAPPAPAQPPGASDEQLAALVKRLQESNLLGKAQDTGLPIIRAIPPARVEVGDRARITGVVGDDGSPPRLKVNGGGAPLFRLSQGQEPIARHTLAFEIEIPTREAGARQFLLEVCDAAGNCVAERLSLTVFAANRPDVTARNFALVVGINDYRRLPGLKTAVADARAVAEVLSERYAFAPENVRLLLNADRAGILGALADLRRELEPEDRLLIYYAGHGQIDPVTEEGFWQPVDAVPDRDFTWIANSDVRRYLKGMPAKHVLVMADSCFSGSLTRGTEALRAIPKDRFYTEIDTAVSRKVISSGGTEPVSDSGTGGHSVFAYYLLKALRENNRPYLASFELFNKLVRAVTNNSNQKPNYGTVANAGDEGYGDFTFILR